MNHARILLLEEDESLSRPLQDELEQRGMAAACIATPDDEEAGLAFGPRIVVINPETGVKPAFGLIRKMAQSAPQTPLVLARSPDVALYRQARSEARSYAVPLIGAVDRPYSLAALERLAEQCPEPHRENETGDQAFLRALIANGRLIPNLTVEFQSKHDLETEAVVGYEALTRLRPRRAINPQLIFSQSLHLELELEATLVILDSAVRFAAALQRMGRTKTVSFNCSAAVLVHRAFVDALGSAIATHRVQPMQVIVEITEDERLADFDRMLASLRLLEALGVGISIDDFGTGMSNLDRVSRVPFTELKIDKSMFWACFEQRLPMAMLTVVLDFCHMKGTKTVIEGIETPEHLAYAKRAGASYGQGFYWGRSVPPQFILPSWR